MKASERIKIAGSELVKGNLSGAVKSLALPENMLLATSQFRGGGQGMWMFGAGPGGNDIHFSYSSVSDALVAYTKCPPVTAIINRKAQAHINGKTWIINTQGKGRDKEATGEAATRLRLRLARPNPIQSWSQFEAQMKIYVQLFGFAPIMVMKPVGFDATYATALWLLPPYLLDIEESSDLYYATVGPLIKSIKLTYKDKSTPLSVEDVFFVKDMTVSMASVVLPESRIKTLRQAINNIIGAYESRNVLINRRGALGILSNAAKDTISALPIDEKEKESIQDGFKRYGLRSGQWQVIVTNAALSWQQMGYPTKDLMLFEEVEGSTMALCDGLGYPDRLLSSQQRNSLGGSDVNEFKKMLYTDFVIPESQNMYEQLNNLFDTAKYSIRLEKDFSHIPILQEDKSQAATARKTLNEALKMEFESGLITLDDWLVELGKDPLPNALGQVRATDPKNSNVPLAVTIGVGGVQGLISVLTAQGMSEEARSATLEIVFGLTPQDAGRMAQGGSGSQDQNQGANQNQNNPNEAA